MKQEEASMQLMYPKNEALSEEMEGEGLERPCQILQTALLVAADKLFPMKQGDGKNHD